MILIYFIFGELFRLYFVFSYFLAFSLNWGWWGVHLPNRDPSHLGFACFFIYCGSGSSLCFILNDFSIFNTSGIPGDFYHIFLTIVSIDQSLNLKINLGEISASDFCAQKHQFRAFLSSVHATSAPKSTNYESPTGIQNKN